MPDDLTPVYTGVGAAPPGTPSVYTGVGAPPPQPLSPVEAARQNLALVQRFQQPSRSSPEDLVDQAIASRQQFEARRQQLTNQLSYAGRRQAAGIAAQLHGLDENERSLRWEANQRRVMAHEQASELDHRLKT